MFSLHDDHSNLHKIVGGHSPPGGAVGIGIHSAADARNSRWNEFHMNPLNPVTSLSNPNLRPDPECDGSENHANGAEVCVLNAWSVLEVGAIRAGHHPAFLHLELAENILLEDLTNGTFRRARTAIDHVKRTVAEALRVRNQIFRLRPSACNV